MAVLRSRNSVAGTHQGALKALTTGVSINLAGGTHHAYADHGEGFSVLNDIAISSTILISESLVKRILIVDLDVHQGNGNAQIFSNEERVFTFSMHGKDNYPLKKETSDLDIPLDTGTGDEVYLSILSETLPKLIEEHQPEIVYYQSGVDVLASDRVDTIW